MLFDARRDLGSSTLLFWTKILWIFHAPIERRSKLKLRSNTDEHAWAESTRCEMRDASDDRMKMDVKSFSFIERLLFCDRIMRMSMKMDSISNRNSVNNGKLCTHHLKKKKKERFASSVTKMVSWGNKISEISQQTSK